MPAVLTGNAEVEGSRLQCILYSSVSLAGAQVGGVGAREFQRTLHASVRLQESCTGQDPLVHVGSLAGVVQGNAGIGCGPSRARWRYAVRLD